MLGLLLNGARRVTHSVCSPWTLSAVCWFQQSLGTVPLCTGGPSVWHSVERQALSTARGFAAERSDAKRSTGRRAAPLLQWQESARRRGAARPPLAHRPWAVGSRPSRSLTPGRKAAPSAAAGRSPRDREVAESVRTAPADGKASFIGIGIHPSLVVRPWHAYC